MEKEILPIGSVVILDKSPQVKLVIIGYRPTKDDGTMKDYISVPYPIGCIDNKTFIAFDNSQISEIVFKGYSDRLFDIYKAQ